MPIVDRGRRRATAAQAKLATRPSVTSIAALTFLFVCLVLGGGVSQPGFPFLIIGFVGTLVLVIAILNGGWGALWRLPILCRLAIFAIILIPLLQLAPLPPAIWHALPGRALPAEILGVSGENGWHPMTLSLSGTLETLLLSLWLTGFLLAALKMTERDIAIAFGILAAMGVVHILIGAAQFLSNGSMLNFYGSDHRQYLIGLFANKNHSGLFLALLVVVIAAFVPRDPTERRRTILLWLPVVIVVLVADVATFSRAGLLLGFAALIGAMAVARLDMPKVARWRLGVGVLVVVAFAMLLSTTEVANSVLARFRDVGDDSRWLFWAGSQALAKLYLPWGAGMGTFVDVFNPAEKLDWVRATYVNHAHNDYLELVIEAGIPGVVALAMVAGAVAQMGFRAWGSRTTVTGYRALLGMVMILLCAAHSIGDYPLRRVGIAVIFFFALALLLRISPSRKPSVDRLQNKP
jgi:O-antigen ligase